MVLTGQRMHSHPQRKALNWVRSCTTGRRGGGVRSVRDLGVRDGHGDHDIDGDRDVHGFRDDLGASSLYPLIQFSCVYDGNGAHMVCEACGGDDGDDDAPSLACDDDGGWLSPSCGDRGV